MRLLMPLRMPGGTPRIHGDDYGSRMEEWQIFEIFFSQRDVLMNFFLSTFFVLDYIYL